MLEPSTHAPPPQPRVRCRQTGPNGIAPATMLPVQQLFRKVPVHNVGKYHSIQKKMLHFSSDASAKHLPAFNLWMLAPAKRKRTAAKTTKEWKINTACGSSLQDGSRTLLESSGTWSARHAVVVFRFLIAEHSMPRRRASCGDNFFKSFLLSCFRMMRQ
jgi:hypothetical protein